MQPVVRMEDAFVMQESQNFSDLRCEDQGELNSSIPRLRDRWVPHKLCIIEECIRVNYHLKVCTQWSQMVGHINCILGLNMSSCVP